MFQVQQARTFGSARGMADTGSPSVLIEQAMRMLGVSRRTVYYWIRQGRLRTIRTRCGSQRVLVSSMPELSGSRESAASDSRAESSEVLNSVSA
jgi:excisionase family DNA binding protein